MRNTPEPIPLEIRIPRVILREHQRAMLAYPIDTTEPMEAFQLPLLSAYLVNWTIGLLLTCFFDRHRCMVALLAINPQNMEWSFVLPHQRCFQDHAEWQPETAAKWPAGLLLAGSIQTGLATDLDRIKQFGMAFDGVHVVLGQGFSQPLYFCRSQNKVRELREEFVVKHRTLDLLAQAAPRMELV